MAKETFVLTLPLKVEKWQADILDKRYELLRQVYNMVRQKLLCQYIYFSQQKAYKECGKDTKKKGKFFAEHPFYIKIDGEPCEIKFPTWKKSNTTASNSIAKFVSKLSS